MAVFIYTMKKSVKHFIGQIMSLHGDVISVKFLKSTGHGKFVWLEKEGMDMLQNSTIAIILPEPEMDRHGILSFSKVCLSHYKLWKVAWCFQWFLGILLTYQIMIIYCTVITYKVAVINEKITIISATQYNGFNFS